METIDPDAIVAAHAHIADRRTRVREVSSTLAAVEQLRIGLLRMRREDLIEMVYQGNPEPERGAISDVARQVGLSRARIHQIINSPEPELADE